MQTITLKDTRKVSIETIFMQNGNLIFFWTETSGALKIVILDLKMFRIQFLNRTCYINKYYNRKKCHYQKENMLFLFLHRIRSFSKIGFSA